MSNDYRLNLLSEELDKYKAAVFKLTEQRNKLKSALEEIREITKIAFIVCDDECGNANKFAEIQDKINEVLN